MEIIKHIEEPGTTGSKFSCLVSLSFFFFWINNGPDGLSAKISDKSLHFSMVQGMNECFFFPYVMNTKALIIGC